jgi:hypothetical protein
MFLPQIKCTQTTHANITWNAQGYGINRLKEGPCTRLEYQTAENLQYKPTPVSIIVLLVRNVLVQSHLKTKQQGIRHTQHVLQASIKCDSEKTINSILMPHLSTCKPPWRNHVMVHGAMNSVDQLAHTSLEDQCEPENTALVSQKQVFDRIPARPLKTEVSLCKKTYCT